LDCGTVNLISQVLSHDFIERIAFASAALAFDYAGPGAVNWCEGIIWLSLHCDGYSAQLRAKITG